MLIFPFDEHLFNQASPRQNVCTAKFAFLSVFSNKKINFLSGVESPGLSPARNCDRRRTAIIVFAITVSVAMA